MNTSTLLILGAAGTISGIILYYDAHKFDDHEYFLEMTARGRITGNNPGDTSVLPGIWTVFKGFWTTGVDEATKIPGKISGLVGENIGDALSAWLSAILSSPTTILVGVALVGGLILTILILKKV